MMLMKTFGMLVVQFWEKGGLNQVMLRFLFFPVALLCSSSTLGW